MFEIIYKLVISHLLGDYFLQTSYIAETKEGRKTDEGKEPPNIWSLIVHCVLYTLPFGIFWGFTPEVFLAVFLPHFVIDLLKVHNTLNQVTDQVCHFLVLLVYAVILTQHLWKF